MAEKTRRVHRKTKAPANLCLRKPKGDTTKNNKAAAAMTLFERLREAVFRFIMLCALSKATNHHPAGGAAFQDDVVVRRRHAYPNVDHHHRQAVADCIEFIKMKAYSDDEIILDRGSVDVDDDVAVSVPVPVR
ncbi:unnamed protein product [Citrullus colocynthis]|uniref:Uncharacterized protein n=1 Tax=Citrullus colocynthis TaxID=252529 RepID=A0ABP0YNL9_9ROSI